MTGLTSIMLKDDMSLPVFACLCLRQFGVCVRMRDEDPRALPPRFASRERLEEAQFSYEKAKRDLRDFAAKTVAERNGMALRDIEQQINLVADRAKLVKEQRDKLDAMGKQILDWDAPEELKDLRSFMLEQIQLSHDISSPSSIPSVSEWIDDYESSLKGDIEHYGAEIEKEKARIKEHDRILSIFWAEIKKMEVAK